MAVSTSEVDAGVEDLGVRRVSLRFPFCFAVTGGTIGAGGRGLG
jgi:hypothetical protein